VYRDAVITVSSYVYCEVAKGKLREKRTNQPFAALVCRLMVSTPVSHVITGITTQRRTPEGWKAELAAWLTHSGHLTNEVVTCQP